MGVLRPRFRLKTLLVTLAVAAVSCAVVWQFWPRWRAHQARMRFESGAAQFRAGMSINDITAIVGHGDWASFSSDARGNMVALTPYFLDGAWYCVYLHLDRKSGQRTGRRIPSTWVATYRLEVPPKDYLPQTQAAKDRVKRRMAASAASSNGRALLGEDARRTAYIKDFYMHITGRAKEDLGIRYEELPGGGAKTGG